MRVEDLDLLRRNVSDQTRFELFELQARLAERAVKAVELALDLLERDAPRVHVVERHGMPKHGPHRESGRYRGPAQDGRYAFDCRSGRNGLGGLGGLRDLGGLDRCGGLEGAIGARRRLGPGLDRGLG